MTAGPAPPRPYWPRRAPGGRGLAEGEELRPLRGGAGRHLQRRGVDRRGNKAKGTNEGSATCAEGAGPRPAPRPSGRGAGRASHPRQAAIGAAPGLGAWLGQSPPPKRGGGRSAPAGGSCRGHGGARGGRRMEEAGGCRGGFVGAPPPPWERPGAAAELEYVDLDEFLREHGLPPSPEPPPRPRETGRWVSPGGDTPTRGAPGPPRGPPTPPAPGEPLLEAEALGGPGGGPFDPRRLRFSQDELRPQPIARKARKVHVPEEQKDEKYWSRRSKNNAAAKRSRDARRLKENQISVRAAFLERENAALRQEVAAARRELARFRALLARYEARHGAL
ncbi:D site-binding protein [Haliaeetus albicilla]|uniref:D site-binding protein n=1 Tax=Haliaeetus albicilla TaxID=8969 RepID=UPI0037E94DC3